MNSGYIHSQVLYLKHRIQTFRDELTRGRLSSEERELKALELEVDELALVTYSKADKAAPY